MPLGNIFKLPALIFMMQYHNDRQILLFSFFTKIMVMSGVTGITSILTAALSKKKKTEIKRMLFMKARPLKTLRLRIPLNK